MANSSQVVIFLFCAFLLTFAASKPAERFTKEHKQMLEKIAEMLENPSYGRSRIGLLKKESSQQKDERLNRSLAGLLKLVDVVGHVDSFLHGRTKNVVKKLNAMCEIDEDDMTRCGRSPSLQQQKIVISEDFPKD